MDTIKEADDFQLKLIHKLLAIRTKLNRWQKVIDNRLGHDKDVMQDARDEVMQECIDAIRAILDK